DIIGVDGGEVFAGSWPGENIRAAATRQVGAQHAPLRAGGLLAGLAKQCVHLVSDTDRAPVHERAILQRLKVAFEGVFFRTVPPYQPRACRLPLRVGEQLQDYCTVILEVERNDTVSRVLLRAFRRLEDAQFADGISARRCLVIVLDQADALPVRAKL